MGEISTVISDFIVTQIMHGSVGDKLTNDRLLLEEGILDSLGLQQLITFLEVKYNILIDDEYLMPEYFTSVGTISELVQSILDQ